MQTRIKTRYSHVYISIRVNVNNQWERTRALDWNEDGFTFHLHEKLGMQTVQFKKELKDFSGAIVWTLKNYNDEVILEKIINNLLFSRLIKLSTETTTIRRIFRMISTVGLVEEKKKLLSLGGCTVSEAEIQSLVDAYKQEFPIYRYGVKVDSPAWSEVVRATLAAASPLETLNEIAKEFSELGHNKPKLKA